MYQQFVPPPPPPPPVAQPTNPLAIPVTWYIDVPTSSVGAVLTVVPTIQDKFHTAITLASGGDDRTQWSRFSVFGKPKEIHYSIAELKTVTPIVEAGYSAVAPFPHGMTAPEDVNEAVMPLYHGAWTEFCLRTRQGH